MDNEFADLEAELKQLRPRATRTDLEVRLAKVLEPAVADRVGGSPTRTRSDYRTATAWTSWKWVNWGVAAALVALMSVWSVLAPPSVAPDLQARMAADPGDAMAAAPSELNDALKPVRAGRTLLASRIDGVVELADGSSAQRVRDYYLDTIVWRDPAGHRQLKWEVPREAVRFVGLAAY